MKKTVNLLLALGMILVIMVLFTLPKSSFGAETIDRSQFADHDFSSIDWDVASSNIKSYTEYKQNYMNTTNSYVISFNSAQELYQFSVDVSYKNQSLTKTQKEHLMQQNYTLGSDIDYSVIKGKRFIPIGYDFTLPSNNSKHTLKFSGTFDGRGFEIKNLYFSDFQSVIVEDPVANSEIKIPIAISNYYAMFNYVLNTGSIKNIGLINPIVDFPIQHDDINKFSNLVGKNNGLVENVFVLESQGIINGGMRIAGTPTNDPTKQKSASGIVHTNNGVFKDAYFAGEGVVNASYIYAIKREAVLYKNNNLNQLDVKNLVHDETIYKTSVNVGGTNIAINAPVNSTGVSTSDLKIGTTHLTNGVWYYYANDRYPALWGLDYDTTNNNYEINDAVDMISFTKLLNLSTINNNLSFSDSSYVLINNINFADVAADAYQTPTVDFLGVFDGQNKQISNLTLKQGVNIDSGYYVGLFSVLNGTVKNLKLENFQIALENYGNYYGQHFYIGSVTGLLDSGLINNVFVRGSINIGNSKIGAFSVGGIAGEANGQIIRVYNEASINLGTHTYLNNEKLGSVFNVGGIVGNATSNKQLVLYNAKNIGQIQGYNAENFQSTISQVNINIGGVIGYVNNDNVKHNLGLLTNKGELVVGKISSNIATLTITNHVAGVIGYSTGSKYEFNEYQGLWENDANIIFTNVNQVTKAAGVIVSNHNTTMTFVQMFSKSNLIVSNSNVTAAALIYNIGLNININHAKTTGRYDFSINNRSLSVAIHNENLTNQMNLRYLEINTDINVQNTNSVEVSYAGVTLQRNTNYYNVIYNGKFNVKETNTEDTPLWIAGITKELSSGYLMINSMVEGSINVVANREGNIYLGGLVNRNLSGDLHLKDNRTTYPRPKAETGIINSISKTKITSTIDNNTYGIRGLTNIFAGGIATMNSGSIQDAVNLEDIKIVNLDSYVESRLSFDSTNAGVVSKFESGVILGGVTAIITSGHSRIFDTSNKGNIVGMSEHFVRTGGVLGVSLLVELNSGNINNNLYATTPSSLNGEYISNSVLSNGINYGVVSAIGKTIGVYSKANASQNNRLFFEGGNQLGSTITMRSTVGTQERLPIYASSGGVIGYGLSKMYRMLNHGNVYSTDVAGGVVGATFASGGSTDTIVNINTAINYGKVRAINNFFYPVLDKVIIPHTYQATELYAPNSDFIIPALANGNVDIRRHPQSKRGIGGVFGRIQRELSHFMTSVGGSFDFVVNMDKDVDLIGRLDQVHNYSSSSRFFQFYDAIYFSAKENDTTQAVFTGFEYTKERDIIVEAGSLQARYIYTSETSWFRTRYYKQLQYKIPITMNVYSEEHIYHQLGRRSEFLETTIGIANHPGTNWENVGSREEINQSEYNSGTNAVFQKTITSPEILSTESVYGFKKVKDVPYISESSTTPNAQYVYDEDFVMRDSSVLVDGEPITSFIYYAENALLADRFQQTRPDGMYVLASSAGSDFGAVLPRNLKITNLKTLSRNIPTNIDYTNIRLNPGFEESTESTSWLISDPTLVTNYESLYQTKLNDKSALLEENQVFKIEDQNQSGIILDNPVIDGNKITFNIYRSMLAYNFNLDFKIINALLPSNALIAKTDATFTALNNTTDLNIATGTLAPNLTINLTGKSGVVELGKFISFSEAAINDIAFFGQTNGKYQTEYTIYLNIIEQTISPPLGPEVRIDNQSTWQTYQNKVTITDKLEVRFRDRTVLNGGFISSSFVMDDYVTLYYIKDNNERIIVNKNYYTITSTKKDANRYFSFTIDFSDKLRPKDHYVIGYKFFPADYEKDIFVNYNREITNHITNLIANTGTYYEKDANINGNVAFGDVSLLGGITFTPIIDNNIPEYLNNTTYQLANIKYFETSDFFDISTIEVMQSINNGYYSYDLLFTLSSGNDITITLKEDELKEVYYKNGIRIPTGTTTIKREAAQTSLSVDYNFITAVEKTFNLNDFIIKVDGQLLNDFDPDASKITATYHKGVIRFIVTDKLLPKLNGTILEPYIITIEIKRDTFTINAGGLAITKLEGTNSYLKDIKFSTIISETSYPEINISDSDGNVITSPYNTSIYYAGIDYNNADTDKKTDFRVDGKVQKVPLDEFLPYMIEYLPIGASIQRKLYDTATQQEAGYTDNVSLEDLTYYNDLFADFTINPKTGLPLVDDEVAVITYKVTSEDKSHSVYYHVTVTDVTNNVTLSFEFTYKDSLGNIIDITDINSPLKENLFTINVLNHDVIGMNYLSGLNENTVINEVNNFPTFTGIDKTNTTTNMFYAPYISGLSYRFSRNLSGVYQIRIDVPKEYQYKIYFKNGIGSTMEEQLNLFPIAHEGDNNQGYYFYINWSESLRTRSFRVEVSKIIAHPSWGLTDNN